MELNIYDIFYKHKDKVTNRQCGFKVCNNCDHFDGDYHAFEAFPDFYFGTFPKNKRYELLIDIMIVDFQTVNKPDLVQTQICIEAKACLKGSKNIVLSNSALEEEDLNFLLSTYNDFIQSTGIEKYEAAAQDKSLYLTRYLTMNNFLYHIRQFMAFNLYLDYGLTRHEAEPFVQSDEIVKYYCQNNIGFKELMNFARNAKELEELILLNHAY